MDADNLLMKSCIDFGLAVMLVFFSFHIDKLDPVVADVLIGWI